MNQRRVFIKQNRECAETPQQACGDLFCVESRATSQNPLGERLLARGGGLKALILDLVSAQESCESDVKKALAFNLVSTQKSCKSNKKEALALNFQREAEILRHCERSEAIQSCCHSVLDMESLKQTHIFSPVMLNLFQHLASLECNLFTDKILKRVQDDNLTMEGLLCFP